MPIPELDADGFLPKGIHECTLDEVQERFGGFRNSDRRPNLFAKLQEFVQEARLTLLVTGVILDGSFVTDKAVPEDIDLILILREHHDFTATLRPFEYNVLSRRRVRKHFGFDVLVACEGSAELAEFVEFFFQIRGRYDRQKGLLRVDL